MAQDARSGARRKGPSAGLRWRVTSSKLRPFLATNSASLSATLRTSPSSGAGGGADGLEPAGARGAQGPLSARGGPGVGAAACLQHALCLSEPMRSLRAAFEDTAAELRRLQAGKHVKGRKAFTSRTWSRPGALPLGILRRARR